MGVFVAAGRDAFWRFDDLAFANQTSLSRDQYLLWAQQAGVSDLGAYAAGLDGHQWTFAVEDDRHQAATLGAPGTPAFFINGVFLSGAQPIDAFEKVIDDQLGKAQALLDAGTPPARLYARLAADGRVASAAAQQDRDRTKEKEEEQSARTIHKIPLGKAPSRGPATALVTIVEFADFQCPFSARVQPTLDALRTEYGDKLRIVWRNEPLPNHKAAEPAAEAAFEVRDEKGDAAFWDVHDRLFAGQKGLVQGDKPDLDAIADFASAAGASRARVMAAMAGRTRKAQIVADVSLADDFQATGTPSFFVNGRRIVGAQPKEKFEKIIDEELGKAQALVTQGVRPADVYVALTKDGAGPIPSRDARPARVARERSGPGRGGGEGDRPRVGRLPVPVLWPRGGDTRADRQGLRSSHSLRVARFPPVDAPAREARRRGCARGLRTEGRHGLLGHARHALCEPGAPRAGGPRRLRGRASPRCHPLGGGPRWRFARRRDRGGREGRRRRHHLGHAGLHGRRGRRQPWLLPVGRAGRATPQADRPRPHRGQVAR